MTGGARDKVSAVWTSGIIAIHSEVSPSLGLGLVWPLETISTCTGSAPRWVLRARIHRVATHLASLDWWVAPGSARGQGFTENNIILMVKEAMIQHSL